MNTLPLPVSASVFSRLLVWLFALGLLAARLHAHSHIDAGPDSADPTRLALTGPSAQTALYVPPGEPFSADAQSFPGGYYANELTFSSEEPDGSRPRIELVSVAGPAGGSFGFWEVGAAAPTWSRPSGWSATAGDRPSLTTYEDQSGYGHIHGRLFTATHPGTYTLVFRAIDDAGLRSPSAPKTLTLQVLATPPLRIRVVAGEARLTFTSRPNLSYDLQVSTDLVDWVGVEPHLVLFGTGGDFELTDPLAGRPRVFYRLVEYF